jgi:hypothetical protein
MFANDRVNLCKMRSMDRFGHRRGYERKGGELGYSLRARIVGHLRQLRKLSEFTETPYKLRMRC